MCLFPHSSSVSVEQITNLSSTLTLWATFNKLSAIHWVGSTIHLSIIHLLSYHLSHYTFIGWSYLQAKSRVHPDQVALPSTRVTTTHSHMEGQFRVMNSPLPKCMFLDYGRTQRELTQTRGEHAKYTQKSPWLPGRVKSATSKATFANHCTTALGGSTILTRCPH